MSDRMFRFGVVAGQTRSGEDWARTARRAVDLGYDTLLIPDTLYTPAPMVTLATAAAVAPGLRVGTYVLSVANRTPALVAWEAGTMQVLTGGRFELGLGTGRPGSDRDAAVLGGTWGTAGDRVRRVAETIAAVRERPEPAPRILIAASGPRMLRLAAEQADTIALALLPGTTEDELTATVDTVRKLAGDRFDRLELHLNTVAVAPTPDAVPEWVSRMIGGADPRALAAAGGISFLIGTTAQIADTLLRRRDRLGISYVATGETSMEDLAPVIERLR